MSLKLPRLQFNQDIVTEKGVPTNTFQIWWQKVAEALEQAVSDIVNAVISIGGLEALTDSALFPDGTVKPDKVTTESIVSNGVTKPYFVQILSNVTLPDGADTVIASLAVNKDIADSDMQISSICRMDSSDDLRGDFTIKRDGVVIDTIGLFANGAGGDFRIPISLLYRDVVAATGAHTYTVNFTRNGGASAVSAQAGSTLEVVEVKR